MLPTIEATIDKFGQINWAEPVQIEKSQKILITLNRRLLFYVIECRMKFLN